MRSDDFAAERERMVREQIEGRGVRHARTLEVLRALPRHRFVPGPLVHVAYADSPLPIGHDQTISQPYIVAFMTAALEADSGHKVLEVGTGSGYQACVLGRLGAEVYTIEIVEPLARQAERTIAGVGCGRVQVRAGDGYRGWPEAAPFDRIMVTAAPEKVPQPLLDQLVDGGRMVVPVGAQHGEQELRVLTRRGARIHEQSLLPVRFVPMTGEAEKK